ncbi:type IV secretion system protein [Campylobacter fetus subsp. venerealis]|uniref:Type IV secretory pathway, VirB3-like protein n=1 Tax=Campylobacter hyointestinalis subsp. hyointestinalis TaxID=91352 RepID=A0A9W5APT4_CAMHY|nr:MULTISPECIES: type IV secretion system protein [Campylobacter]MBC3781447.1 type IV secretion system protein [Campylobacter fetus subsp. fetus]MBC3782905.1 type IV secretion system protein [Campylobacter fetus subsp. venerealis]MBK3499225.1 type IV secretion system protein [Campylobacter fetus subsp. venerealis]MBK3501168.1 type IV secretion system protein [Campylobacter fetus subsp. venerealis]MBK3503185.1 type IV secretion system protein [Campylobacter fetus subsp. venerealis]
MSKDYDFNTGLDFEASVRYMVEKSNSRAWLVAFCAIFVAVISIVAVILLTPLKTVEPYVIRVDNVTGMVDIITKLDVEQINQNEALDKYFVGTYVKAREGYYYELLNSDYILVQLMSSDQIAAGYREIYSGDNARDQILKNNTEVKVHILSIVLGSSNGVKTATVRANLVTKTDNKGESVSTKVITLSYDYLTGLINEENRIQNPLGFKVLTYRVDDEIVRR